MLAPQQYQTACVPAKSVQRRVGVQNAADTTIAWVPLFQTCDAFEPCMLT